MATLGSLNPTERFLGPPAGWRACRLALADVHGLWGGHALDLHGTGMGWASTVDRAGRERRFPVVIAPAAVDALFSLLIAHDFLELTFPARPGVPDEARPVVSVTNAGGETRAVAKWANDRMPTFDLVYQALLALIREAAR
jgi:hypothetical protein